MSSNDRQIIAEIVNKLETSWNAADGAGFAQPFSEDADFVNIRGEHFRTRVAIAKGHQVIFDTIYRGSSVQFEVESVRSLDSGVLLAHLKSTLRAPSGPLEGEHHSLISIVVVQDGNQWRIAALHNTLVAQPPSFNTGKTASE